MIFESGSQIGSDVVVQTGLCDIGTVCANLIGRAFAGNHNRDMPRLRFVGIVIDRQHESSVPGILVRGDGIINRLPTGNAAGP